MTIITIDGNIGSGKTSILNYLHKYNKISIDLEPVENWQQYIDNIYSNDKKDIFKFQIRVWLDRCWIQEKQEKSLILMERSPYFIKNVFINNYYNSGDLTLNEYNTLMNLFLKTDHIWCPNAIIYLRSNPINCLARIHKRNRKGEDKIELGYINALHELHESAYENAINNRMNIIVIDVENKSISELANEIYNSLVFKKEFINK